MEMNTRLQVEHPVTEAITGLDLVEWQLRVAAGEPLPLEQDQISLQGAAIEARLYAENPTAGFLPSTGRLDRLGLPEQLVRVDSGVEQGGEVTPFYDPMIAKLIAHAPTRQAAAARLAEACRSVEVWPVKSNAGFLARCLAQTDFLAGEVDTGFIERHSDELLQSPHASVMALFAAAKARAQPSAGDHSPWSNLIGFRLNQSPQLRASFQVGDEVKSIVVGGWWEQGSDLPVLRLKDRLIVFLDGDTFEFAEPRDLGAEETASGDGAIRAPMPGRVVQVQAKPKARVAKGAPLVVLEAMKMEHALTAPFDGVVAEVLVAAGEQVSEGALLARLERAGE
jgi:acetyl/propionyl-CoA carboxylase alpha subunit